MDDRIAWDIYFAQLAAWRFHPGYLRDPEKRPSLEECAKAADEMLALRYQKWQR